MGFWKYIEMRRVAIGPLMNVDEQEAVVGAMRGHRNDQSEASVEGGKGREHRDRAESVLGR